MSTHAIYLKNFADFIEKNIGIIYQEANYFQLEHRLNDICTQTGVASISDLWSKVSVGTEPRMKELILDLATNNETSFYRDSAIFKSLIDFIVPELVKKFPNKKVIDIWSAAGSTGQEAYSITMSFHNAKEQNPSFPDCSILVSDISERVLQKSKDGLYNHLDVQRGLPAKNLITFFEKEGDSNWRVKSHLRNKLSFRKLNLLEPFPNLGSFDIIFCRNVLIYQSVENKISVIKKLSQLLPIGGYLILGSAESMIGLSEDFKQIHQERAVFFEKIK